MSENEATLQIISNETKQYISDLGVVTPSIYANTFAKFAFMHDADLENEKLVTDELLNEKISLFTNMQNSTSQNALKLSESTTKAICAIKDKDEIVLAQVLQETQNLRAEIEKLKESIYRDPLTNAFNRKWMHDNYLDEPAQKFTADGTLAIIDLNYFKLINDNYGHIIGDKVLVFMANQLRKTLGNVVRYGGDEFIIVCPASSSPQTALEKLVKLREEILKKNIKTKEASFKVSFSIGTEAFKEGELLVDIIDKADKNMYEDKVKIKKVVTGI